jgi:hypothetical protein
MKMFKTSLGRHFEGVRIQDWYFSLFNLVNIILDFGLEVKGNFVDRRE